MTFLYFFAIFLFIILCVLLCATILIQEGSAGGLGALGGGEVGESLFGASTADVLKRFTGWLAVVFLVSCVVLSLWTEVLGRHKTTGVPYNIEQIDE